jgi:hypothetical protein
MVMSQTTSGAANGSPDSKPDSKSKATEQVYTSESIDEAIRKLQSLTDIQIKLRKERNSIESLDLMQRMLDGELLSEDELNTVKSSLKGLSKYASLHNSYKTCLEEAQQARDLIDQVIGGPFAPKTTNEPERSPNPKSTSTNGKPKPAVVEN